LARAAFALAIAGPAYAGEMKTLIAVAPIAARQECQLYRGTSGSLRTHSEGSANIHANLFGVGAGARSESDVDLRWRTFFVQSCVRHFDGIRAAIEAALASSGTVVIGPGAMVLRGTVGNFAKAGSNYNDTSLTGQSYGISSQGITVTFDFTLSDRAGRKIFGVPVSAAIDTGLQVNARGTSVGDQSSGEGVYSQFEQQIAKAAARAVAFHFTPLTVVSKTARATQFNYGAPLIEVGQTIAATSPDGNSSFRYRVVSVGDRTALATPLGGLGDEAAVGPGSKGRVLESADAELREGEPRNELP
jgi:hypothetical protein